MAEEFAGRYLLLDPIGEGGMGTVWRVKDLKQNRVVAAKILRQSHSTSLLRFVREQSLRIQHPHVLMPLGWAGEDDRVLFTMPIVAGGSLATLVGDYGPLPPLFAAEILRQIASALIAVHQRRLIHRDVKPANILLDATGAGRPHAYLTDFGIAVELDGPRFTEAGLVTGTPGYLAPELAALGEPAPASDAYSLGSVGLYLLTGVRPQDVPRQGPAPSGVPSALWDTVLALTEPDAERRMSLPDALVRLEAAELAWHEGAAGEVEVFNHFSPEAPADPETVVLDASENSGEAANRRPTRDLLVFGFFGLVMILGIILLLL